MPSYIKSAAQSFVPTQLFQPDWAALQGIAQTKQNQYNQGLQKINSIYSSVFNSQVTNQHNQEKKDLYIANAQNQLDSIKSQDLSKFSVQQQANTIFQPFMNDKDLQYDIAATNNAQQQIDHAAGLKNATDGDTRDRYWETGVQYVQNGLDQLRNADPNSIKWAAQSSMSRRYVDAYDINKNLNKAAKDANMDMQ